MGKRMSHTVCCGQGSRLAAGVREGARYVVMLAMLHGTRTRGAPLLSVVDLADDGVIGCAEVLGMRRPRLLVAGGAVVVSVT